MRGVADLWPEFAAHDKGGVTLRHVLLHTAGVHGLPVDITLEDLCNSKPLCAVLADAKTVVEARNPIWLSRIDIWIPRRRGCFGSQPFERTADLT